MAKKKKEPSRFRVGFSNGDYIEVRGTGDFVKRHQDYLTGVMTEYLKQWRDSEIKRRGEAAVMRDLNAMLDIADRQLSRIKASGKGGRVTITNRKRSSK